MASVVSVTWAVVWMLCSIRLATAPRMPVRGTTPPAAAPGAAAGADCAAIAASTSSMRILPCGPLPVTMARSMLFSRARRRAAGTTGTRPSGDSAAAGACNAASTSASRIRPLGPLPRTWERSTPRSRAIRRAAGTTCTPTPLARAPLAAGAACVAGAADAALAEAAGPANGSSSSPGSAMTHSTPRMGTIWPSWAMMRLRMPEAVDSSSVCSLAVSTSTMGSPSATVSPSCFSQRTMVPSCISMPHCGRTISHAITATPELAR